jgi:hypothetical protein
VLLASPRRRLPDISPSIRASKLVGALVLFRPTDRRRRHVDRPRNGTEAAAQRSTSTEG